MLKDAASIFDTSTRTIQEWIRDGKLPARELPGRGQFLSADLEQFLRSSVRKAHPPEDNDDSTNENAPGETRRPRSERRRQGK